MCFPRGEMRDSAEDDHFVMLELEAKVSLQRKKEKMYCGYSSID